MAKEKKSKFRNQDDNVLENEIVNNEILVEETIDEVKIDKIEKDNSSVKINKPKVELKEYVLKRKLKVGGKWRQVGETIKLTTEGYESLKIKKVI